MFCDNSLPCFPIRWDKTDTFVMKITAMDDDQDGNINSQIAYQIVSEEPKGSESMFKIDEKTGNIYVNKPTLDREVS